VEYSIPPSLHLYAEISNAGQDEHPCAPQEGQTRRETVTSKGGSSDVGYRKRSKGHRWRNGDYWDEAREETPS
jgi:hypothetical protein